MDPVFLPDNGQMAKKIWIRKQKNLKQKNLLEDFNKAFIEREVFTLATKEELKYDRPKFYSSLVESHKDLLSTP